MPHSGEKLVKPENAYCTEPSPTISLEQFTDCICGSPPERVNAKSLCFRVLSPFFFSLKLQNWMLSLCSLLSLVSDHHPPKREIEGLPIKTSWWWNVKNVEYLIPTFVICPKADISMSTKMLSWYRPSGASSPFELWGVSEQVSGDKNTKMSQSWGEFGTLISLDTWGVRAGHICYKSDQKHIGTRPKVSAAVGLTLMSIS